MSAEGKPERIRTAVPAPGADPAYDSRCGHLSPSGLYICIKRPRHEGRHRMVWLDDSLRRVLSKRGVR